MREYDNGVVAGVVSGMAKVSSSVGGKLFKFVDSLFKLSESTDIDDGVRDDEIKALLASTLNGNDTIKMIMSPTALEVMSQLFSQTK